jgi:hypothetical protein
MPDPFADGTAGADHIADHASVNICCGIMPLHVYFRRMR